MFIEIFFFSVNKKSPFTEAVCKRGMFEVFINKN